MKKKILVVDDDKQVKAYLSKVLSEVGGRFILTTSKELAGSFGGLPIESKTGEGTDMECIS